MKKILAGLLALSQALGPVALAQTTPLTPEQAQALKQKGASLANLTQSQSPVFNEDGTLTRDSSGAVQQTATSQQSIVAKGAYFQGITGVQSLDVTANPGKGSSAGAKINTSHGGDFSCASQLGQRQTIGSTVVQLNSCSGPISNVNGASVSLCTALQAGGVCDIKAHPESFTDYALQTGSWTAIPNGNLGFSCTASGVCRITIVASTDATADGNTLKQKAVEKAAAGGTNTLSTAVQQTVESKTDAQQQTAIAARDCFILNEDRIAQGLTALTCDGKAETSVPGGTTSAANASTPAANCGQDQMACLRTTTHSVSYTRSCTRTFPLTEYSVPWLVPSTTCNLKMPPVAPAGPADAASASSAAPAPAVPTNSCSDSDLQGAVKVASTQNACDASGNCTPTEWTDSYVFPNKAAASGAGTVYPAPLAGAPGASCSNKGNGSLGGCADGGWFGRTLDDSQCFTSTSVTLPDGSIATSTSALTYSEKTGCGYCVQPLYTDTCYAQSTTSQPADSCGVLPDGCELTASTPKSSVNGLTTAQEETYTCKKEETSCAQYQTPAGCATNLAQGLDHAPPSTSNTAAFNEALTDSAVMAAIQKSTADSNNVSVPKIFGGEDLRCRTPVGYLSGLLLNDCCRVSLERTGGSRPMHKCTDPEVKLAAARRANQTIAMGDYCSKEIGVWPVKKCVERTQSYCSFDGVLARVIQTQGRQQLAAMVNSGSSSAESVHLTFPYYKDAGGWGAPSTVNGVTVVPWQYPAYCSSPTAADAALTANPAALACPNILTQWFAVCDKDSCGDMPGTPEMGSTTWLVRQLDPLKNHVESISRTASVDGACDPATTQCSYQVTAWPAASGGKSTLAREWTFALYTSEAADADTYSLGDYLFKPHPIQGSANGSSMPATMALDVSLNYGSTWSTVALPTRTTGNGFAVPGSDVMFTGSCDPAANSCSYKAVGSVTATLKPWGSAQAPDCSGFTPTQLSTLDFGKLDLSEWMATVMGKIAAPDAGKLGSLAEKQANDFYGSMSTGGTQTSTAPMKNLFAQVTPTEGMGPFNAKVYVSAYWPFKDTDISKNTDPVSSVEVDWGDCTLSMMANHSTEMVNNQLAEAFVAAHTFAAPNQLACNAQDASVNHTVHLTVTAKSGIHYTDLQVTNQWRNLSGQTVGFGENTGGSTQQTLSAPLPGTKTTP